MATKKTRELLQECETQAASLYTSFGRLLYENIEARAINYVFDPADPALDVKARRLLRDVIAEKISDRSEKRGASPTRKAVVKAPVKTPVKVSAKAPAKVVVAPKAKIVPRALAVKPAAKPAAHAPKNKMVAVLKGVSHVLSDLSTGRTPSSTEEGLRPEMVVTPVLTQAPLKPSIPRRGQLEPYTKLIVDGQVCTNKVRDIQKDFNECLTAGLLHTTGESTTAYQAAADEKIQSIVGLMGKRREEIKGVMEVKRQFFAENPEVAMWKPEEKFLKQVEDEINETTRRIDTLVVEVIDLFKNINNVFEKDLEATRQARATRAALPLAVVDDVPVPEAVESVEEDQDEDVPEDQGSEEFTGAAEDDVAALQQVEADAPAEMEAAAEGDTAVEDLGDEPNDYGLFETAARKLGRQNTSDDEKLAVLHTLFRNAPKRAAPFFYELTRDADIFFQRKLFSLLSLLDYPTLVDLYRRFITDESSSLRLQGIMGLIKLGSAEAKNVLVSAIRDRDANVRRFIVNHLDHTGGELEETAIAHLSGDPDDRVARIAIRKLGMMSDHFAFVTLIPKLESTNPTICKEAIIALHAMTGTDLGYNYAAPLQERKRQAKPWTALAQKSYTNPHMLREMRKEYLLGSKPSPVVKNAPAVTAKAKPRKVKRA